MVTAFATTKVVHFRPDSKVFPLGVQKKKEGSKNTADLG